MTSLEKEIKENFSNFCHAWRTELESNLTELKKNDTDYLESYQRLVSLQTWRTTILEHRLPPDSLNFFLEAQNDALTSHIQASIGSWRVALKALRSCIENAIVTLYYMDHPVELALWHKGRHKLGFTEALKYLQQHPHLDGVQKNLSGLETLKKEYETLSRAVHGSARAFRMTEDGKAVNLWNTDNKKLSQWKTRERHVIAGINLLYLSFFRDALTGTQLPNLRSAISFSIQESKDIDIRSAYGIRIKRS